VDLKAMSEHSTKENDVVELSGVTIQFAAQVVLDQVNLKIKQGESVVLVGPSGHGKTVLLKTMAGLIEPCRGEARIFSKSWIRLNNAQRNSALKSIGMLFQKNALFDSLTCGENIAFPLRETTDLDEFQIQEKVEFFLEAVGIPHARHLFPDEISGGMQKRLGIARALALRPSLIFYDDPTAGLDPITSRKIIELILQLKKEEKSTIIAITNDMNRAYQLADRIILVVSKTIIETGSPEKTKTYSDERVQQFIHGRVLGPITAMG